MHLLTSTILRRAGLLAAVAGAMALSGCTSVNEEEIRYIGVAPVPPTSAVSVEILRREPHRPHERLGEVILNPSGSPSVADMEQAIREGAARLGADAAVLVFDRTHRIGTVVEGPWWSRTARPIYGRKVVAVAIKFTGRQAGPPG